MGYLARDTCHATQEAAAAAACAAYPLSGPNGLTLCTSVQPGGGGVVIQPPGGAASSVQLLEFAGCDELAPFTDMGAVWLLFLAGAAGIWALRNFVVVHLLGNH